MYEYTYTGFTKTASRRSESGGCRIPSRGSDMGRDIDRTRQHFTAEK